MTVYVVKIGRLFVGHNRNPEAARNTGWRSVVWAKGLIDAEKFSSADEAKLWAKSGPVSPGLWAVFKGGDGDIVASVVPGDRPPCPPMTTVGERYPAERLNWKAMKRKRNHK